MTAPLTDPSYHQPIHSASDLGGEIARGVENIGSGLLNTALHPYNTGKAILQQFSDALPSYQMTRFGPVPVPNQAAAERARAQAQQIAAHPLETAEQMVGQGAAMEGAGMAAGAAGRVIPKIARTGADILAGTTPGVTEDLVNKTQAANTKAQTAAAAATQTNAEKAATQTATNAERAAKANTAKAAQHQTQVQTSLQQTNDAQSAAAARQAAYEKEVQDHADAVAKADEINKAAAEDQTLHGQLARQSQQLAARMVERVRQVAARTKANLDQSYADIRQATGAQTDPETGEVTQPAVTVPRENLASAVEKAQGKLQGSSESIKQFKDILSKAPEEESPTSIQYQGAEIPQGHPLYDVLNEMGKEGGETVPPADFGDLQGYYSELGDKLKGGNLLPDVYLAMRSLQTDIAAMMQKMAAERGVGAKLSSTRAHYRDYMQSFKESSGPNHSGSPLSQVLDAADPTYAVKPLTDPATAARIRTTLSRFDPANNGVGGAGQLYDNFRDVSNRYENSGKLKPAKPVGEPPVAPPPTPEPAFIPNRPAEVQPKVVQGKVVQPDVKKLGLGDIQAAKTASMAQRAKDATTGAAGKITSGAMSGLAAYDFMRNILHGNMEGAGMSVAARGGLAAVQYAYGRILKNPAVIRLLTEPTAADIATIPPDLRGDIPGIVKAAQAQGIKVHPALLTLGARSAQPVQK